MRIIGANKDFDVTANLVGSKSQSNRALMIAYYGGFEPRVKNLSASDDTQLLKKTLQFLSTSNIHVTSRANPTIIDCQNAGTVLRFLVTALSLRNGDWLLTGSERMKQRPVNEIVEALQNIGADIEYTGKDGFPPLRIKGRDLNFDKLSVDVSRSSQFASSILMATPCYRKTIPSSEHNATCDVVTMHLDGALSSLPYIDMTIDIMRRFGVKIHRNGRDIFMQPSEYKDVEYCVESDWTCASYWFEMVALGRNCRATLRNLHLDSAQGDAIVAKWFEQLGVKSVQDGNDLIISHVETDINIIPQFDFTNNPDLYPTIATTCAGLGVEARFTGLSNLVYKESDRGKAMATELAKLKMYYIDSQRDKQPIVFDSHGDHRIAMALAPLALRIGDIEINDAGVVSKSYPGFWEESTPILMSRHPLCE